MHCKLIRKKSICQMLKCTKKKSSSTIRKRHIKVFISTPNINRNSLAPTTVNPLDKRIRMSQERCPENTSSLTWRLPHCCVKMLQWRRLCQRPGLNNRRRGQVVGLAGSSISHQASLYPGRRRASGGRAQRQ